jgi:hypothetical protein
MRMGKFSQAEALAIVPKICEALQYAHEEGVLHRDIKPENLLLDTRGRVKIADFGIAKIVGEEKGPLTLTGTGASLGTPHYMAPEQFENPGQVDHRADIYSLGVVFYEMLTGELPLGRFSAPSARADLDERIDAIVLRALARERDLRQKDARELQTEVETVATTAGQRQSRAVSVDNRSIGQRIWAYRLRIGVAFAFALCLFVAFANWMDRRQLERQLIESQSATPVALTEPVREMPLTTTTLVMNVTPQPEIADIPIPGVNKPVVDEQTRRRQDDAVEEARLRYEQAQARHSRGEITDRDLALANRDVIIAEARGDALAIAKAHYDFSAWEYQQMNRRGNFALEELWKVEQDMNKAQHALERAKAGTNEVQKAFADLKYAERAWGFGMRHREDRIERNGVVTNFISPEQLKKLENDYFYSELNYKRLKQRQEPVPGRTKFGE